MKYECWPSFFLTLKLSGPTDPHHEEFLKPYALKNQPEVWGSPHMIPMPAPNTCSIHLFHMPALHTCPTHPHFTHVPHAFSPYLLPTPVPHTCSSHLSHTPAPHTCSTILFDTPTLVWTCNLTHSCKEAKNVGPCYYRIDQKWYHSRINCVVCLLAPEYLHK